MSVAELGVGESCSSKLELGGVWAKINFVRTAENYIVIETPLGSIGLRLQDWENDVYALEIDSVGDNFADEIEVNRTD